MNTQNNTPAPVVFGLDWLFRWIDRHPRTARALLWLQALALVWALWSYDFTTRI